jgi:hypothetical protein
MNYEGHVFQRNYFEHIKKLHGVSPQANYTERATAACQRS